MIGDGFERILARARDGDELAWTVLYDDLSGQLLGYLRGRGAPEPEDQLGETFLQVARDLPRFTGIEEVRALWSGICDVRMDVTADVARHIDGDAVTRDLIVDLIAEACANAVVHGEAHEVRVALMLEQDDEVALRVEDDGASREARWSTGSSEGVSAGAGQHEGDVPRGLGSEVLRSSCTRFALMPGDRGSTLAASIPLG